MIPLDGSDESKGPQAPVSDGADDETFEDRLRHAVVRHFRFAWRQLTRVRDEERRQESSPGGGAAASGEDAVGTPGGDGAGAVSPVDVGPIGPTAPPAQPPL